MGFRLSPLDKTNDDSREAYMALMKEFSDTAYSHALV